MIVSFCVRGTGRGRALASLGGRGFTLDGVSTMLLFCGHRSAKNKFSAPHAFASFFSVISRARDHHKSRLLKMVQAAAEGLLPHHADWKAAAWLLEKGWPLEYGDRRPLPIPQEEQTPMGTAMYGTLPSGNLAPLDEMMEVARQWHEAAQPKAQRENEPQPKNDDEPMESGTTLPHGALSQSTMAQAKINSAKRPLKRP